MTLKDYISFYQNAGLSDEAARARVGADILMSRISTSSISKNITIKGGVLMCNITGNSRRATMDLDFDFVRLGFSNDSIKGLIKTINDESENMVVSIIGEIKNLKQTNYHGKRVVVAISDPSDSVRIKLDIGVHTFTGINQEAIQFKIQSLKREVNLLANPKEQIFAEKILSLGKLGPVSTRFKDIYDLYFLIQNRLLDQKKTRACLLMFLGAGSYAFSTIEDLYFRIDDTLNNHVFSESASNPDFDWIEAPYDEVRAEILDFLFNLS